ncbi:MAG: NUDIX domain-containing protein [Patescibacteria group bacterium]
MIYDDVLRCIERYLFRYPNEDIKQVVDLIRSDRTSISRTNSKGHVTVSGVVFHDDQLLLIFHNKLQRLLQPGGHLEDSDTSMRKAAEREIYEETGVVPVTSGLYTSDEPIHVDIHHIPTNEKKGETGHWHYDFLFLFETENPEVRIDESEVSGHQWVSLDSVFEDVGLQRVAQKIKHCVHNQSSMMCAHRGWGKHI